MIRILEFAEKRHNIEMQLTDKTPMIIKHLLYLILSPKNSCRDHWISEIHAFLNDIDLLKGSNKLPKQKFIYNSTYGKKVDRVRDVRWLSVMVRDACRKENIICDKSIPEIMELLDSACNQYFDWLSKMLSTVGAVSLDDVEKVINQIINGA